MKHRGPRFSEEEQEFIHTVYHETVASIDGGSEVSNQLVRLGGEIFTAMGECAIHFPVTSQLLPVDHSVCMMLVGIKLATRFPGVADKLGIRSGDDFDTFMKNLLAVPEPAKKKVRKGKDRK